MSLNFKLGTLEPKSFTPRVRVEKKPLNPEPNKRTYDPALIPLSEKTEENRDKSGFLCESCILHEKEIADLREIIREKEGLISETQRKISEMSLELEQTKRKLQESLIRNDQRIEDFQRKAAALDKNSSFDDCLLQSYDDYDHFLENMTSEKTVIDPHLLHKIYLQISSTRLLIGNRFKEIQSFYTEQQKAKEESLKQEILIRRDLDKIKGILLKMLTKSNNEPSISNFDEIKIMLENFQQEKETLSSSRRKNAHKELNSSGLNQRGHSIQLNQTPLNFNPNNRQLTKRASPAQSLSHSLDERTIFLNPFTRNPSPPNPRFTQKQILENTARNDLPIKYLKT